MKQASMKWAVIVGAITGILLPSCQENQGGKTVSGTPAAVNKIMTGDSIKNENTPDVVTGMPGDFDGDGKKEFAFVIKTKQGKGNPVEDGTPDEYAVRFSNHSISSINIGCCEAMLINEGDLNNDGKEELSVYQAPMNGNAYLFITYSNRGGKWEKIVGPMLIPTAGDLVSDSIIQNLVVVKNDSLYINEVDRDTAGAFVLKPVKRTRLK